LDAINASLATDWANPSSSYSEGIAAKDVIEKSKQSVAHMINADTTHEIIFTSGGTEVIHDLVLILVLKNKVLFPLIRQTIGS